MAETCSALRLLPGEPDVCKSSISHGFQMHLSQDICMETSFGENICCTPYCTYPVSRCLKIFQIRRKKVNLPSSIRHITHE